MQIMTSLLTYCVSAQKVQITHNNDDYVSCGRTPLDNQNLACQSPRKTTAPLPILCLAEFLSVPKPHSWMFFADLAAQCSLSATPFGFVLAVRLQPIQDLHPRNHLYAKQTSLKHSINKPPNQPRSHLYAKQTSLSLFLHIYLFIHLVSRAWNWTILLTFIVTLSSWLIQN